MVDKAPAEYFPKRGEIIWVSLNPSLGSEQAGHRPVLVLSQDYYNDKVGLCLCIPITTAIKGYPSEVPLPSDAPIQGVILSDHLRTIDWVRRKAKSAEYIIKEDLLITVFENIKTLCDM